MASVEPRSALDHGRFTRAAAAVMAGARYGLHSRVLSALKAAVHSGTSVDQAALVTELTEHVMSRSPEDQELEAGLLEHVPQLPHLLAKHPYFATRTPVQVGRSIRVTVQGMSAVDRQHPALRLEHVLPGVYTTRFTEADKLAKSYMLAASATCHMQFLLRLLPSLMKAYVARQVGFVTEESARRQRENSTLTHGSGSGDSDDAEVQQLKRMLCVVRDIDLVREVGAKLDALHTYMGAPVDTGGAHVDIPSVLVSVEHQLQKPERVMYLEAPLHRGVTEVFNISRDAVRRKISPDTAGTSSGLPIDGACAREDWLDAALIATGCMLPKGCNLDAVDEVDDLEDPGLADLDADTRADPEARQVLRMAKAERAALVDAGKTLELFVEAPDTTGMSDRDIINLAARLADVEQKVLDETAALLKDEDNVPLAQLQQIAQVKVGLSAVKKYIQSGAVPAGLALTTGNPLADRVGATALLNLFSDCIASKQLLTLPAPSVTIPTVVNFGTPSVYHGV